MTGDDADRLIYSARGEVKWKTAGLYACALPASFVPGMLHISLVGTLLYVLAAGALMGLLLARMRLRLPLVHERGQKLTLYMDQRTTNTDMYDTIRDVMSAAGKWVEE